MSSVHLIYCVASCMYAATIDNRCTTHLPLVKLIKDELIEIDMGDTSPKGHSMPNQQNKISTPSDFYEIWHRCVVH